MSSTSTGPADPLGSGTGSRGEAHTASHGGAATGSATGSVAEPAATHDAADRPATPPLRCVVVTPYATLGGSERWLLALLDGATLADLVDTVMTAVQLGSLVWLYRTPWFAWQRTRPEGGPSIQPLMLLAVLVGVLAGVIGTDSSAVRVDVDL